MRGVGRKEKAIRSVRFSGFQVFKLQVYGPNALRKRT